MFLHQLNPACLQDADEAETCNKVSSPKTIGFTVVGYIQASAGKLQLPPKVY